MKVTVVGSSTFGLKLSDGQNIANVIGKHFSNSPEILIRSALQLNTLTLEELNKLMSSKVAILQVGVFEFLPKLRRRFYPTLPVQHKNQFLYEINIDKYPRVATTLNNYNRILFNLQLVLNIGVQVSDDTALEIFCENLLNRSKSKLEYLFLLTSPPVKHPGSENAVRKTKRILGTITDRHRNTILLDYDVLTKNLNHDKTGHLLSEDRDEFVRRVTNEINKYKIDIK
jgi:hypothetical protein